MRRSRVNAYAGISLGRRLEKILLRVMVLSAVLLTVFQLRSVADPVEFYLKVAGDIDTPAFKYEQYLVDKQDIAGQNRSISLHFQTEPESPVLVKQNDTILGVIGAGSSIEVQPGTVYLDAAHLPYPVNVEILLNGQNYYLELNREIKSFDVRLQADSSS